MKLYKKRVMHVQSCCFDNLNRLIFWRSRCRRRRRCLSYLLSKQLMRSLHQRVPRRVIFDGNRVEWEDLGFDWERGNLVPNAFPLKSGNTGDEVEREAIRQYFILTKSTRLNHSWLNTNQWICSQNWTRAWDLRSYGDLRWATQAPRLGGTDLSTAGVSTLISSTQKSWLFSLSF